MSIVLTEPVKKILLLLKGGEHFSACGMHRAFTYDDIIDELKYGLNTTTEDAKQAIALMKEKGLIESVFRMALDGDDNVIGLNGKGFILTELGRLKAALLQS